MSANLPRRQQVPCSIEMVNTGDDFYAHVVLEGVEVGPGDEVLVHNAPTRLAYGSHLVIDSQATVSRASWLGRCWTRLVARFELGLLYEVSFTTARFAHQKTQKRWPRPVPKNAGRITATPPQLTTRSSP
jgi:hypothetical protein